MGIFCLIIAYTFLSIFIWCCMSENYSTKYALNLWY